jgi:hypothetical protein
MIDRNSTYFDSHSLSEEQIKIYEKYLDNFSKFVGKHPRDISPVRNLTEFGSLFLTYTGRGPERTKLMAIINGLEEISRHQKRRIKRRFIGGEQVTNMGDLIDYIITRKETTKLYEETFKRKE